MQHHPSRAGLTIATSNGPVWNGDVRFNEGWLRQPIDWTKPREIFVNAHGDTFHEKVERAWIDKIMAVAAVTPQHIYQVLTKRSDRMREYWADPETEARIMNEVAWLIETTPQLKKKRCIPILAQRDPWVPLPNVWLGVSVEDNDNRHRLDDLCAIDAAVRWVSAEPLLALLDLRPWLDRLHWVVAGGESDKGPRARPMHPAWPIDLMQQCIDFDVAFLFKQWGDWQPFISAGPVGTYIAHGREYTGKALHCFPDGQYVAHVGKDLAGRKLRGQLHDGRP